jgi:hypothetical protein
MGVRLTSMLGITGVALAAAGEDVTIPPSILSPQPTSRRVSDKTASRQAMLLFITFLLPYLASIVSAVRREIYDSLCHLLRDMIESKYGNFKKK